MKLEIKREIRNKEVWYHVYKNEMYDRAFLSLERADEYVEQIIDEVKNPPVIETIKTIEI